MISFIYICSFCFFTYGKNYRVFQAILFDIIFKIINIAFSSVWKRCFSPVVLRVFSQNTCSDQLYVLILRFGKTSILFLFFVFFFLFVLTFFEDIISKVVAARQMYTTIEGIKPSSGSVLIFFKWAAFGYINNEPIIFICSYKLKVSLVILITLS